MQGEWSITAGLNALFDDFDCQVHNFSIEKPGTLHADIKWRIKEADGDFIERSTVQTFDQVFLPRNSFLTYVSCKRLLLLRNWPHINQ